MSAPGLKFAGLSINSRRFAGVFGTDADAIVSRLATCVRSGPNLPLATVPLNRVATDARIVQKDIAALGDGRILHGGLLLVCDPGSKLLRSICIHPDQHLGMLDSAVLRALSNGINPGFCGSIHMVLILFGITSVFPASLGTQKLWSVSADDIVK